MNEYLNVPKCVQYVKAKVILLLSHIFWWHVCPLSWTLVSCNFHPETEVIYSIALLHTRTHLRSFYFLFLCSVLRWQTGRAPNQSMNFLPRILTAMRCLWKNTGILWVMLFLKSHLQMYYIKCVLNVLCVSVINLLFFLHQGTRVHHCKCGL